MLWVWGTEYVFDTKTNEKADIVLQDKYNSFHAEPNTTCYVVEVKATEVGDHQLLGQIKKAVDILSEQGNRIKHWDKTQGVAIARSFTSSGLRMVLEQGYRAFLYSEHNNIPILTELK